MISINFRDTLAEACGCDKPGEKRPGGPGELRCGCGSLLARVVARAVELKCRRCKRTWRVPLEGSP